jgi:hypothetical protein
VSVMTYALLHPDLNEPAAYKVSGAAATTAIVARLEGPFPVNPRD